ncbi:MAG: NAD(P)/FAD-dependent oxidoreductase [Nitrososphaerales archaeon]
MHREERNKLTPFTFGDKRFDIAVVGAGILGVSISFWLSELYDCSVALIESEQNVGSQASSRNTGVIHRPFYLDPEKKKVFAQAAEKSYSLWSRLASSYNLGWRPSGTIEVAVRDSDLDTLQKYKKWSLSNGMKEEETELLDPSGVRRLEPEVRCAGGIFSKSDTSVVFGELVSAVAELARNNGVKFLGGSEVKQLEEAKEGVRVTLGQGSEKDTVSCGLLINAAGGGALDVAHMMGLAKEYTDLHFRGEYWVVDEPFGSKVGRNVYSVARHKEFPFLDPHFIVRANGKKEIGPNAVLVSGPKAYSGLSSSKSEFVRKIFERPVTPKLRLFLNRKFLSLVSDEWKSSLSKKAMCGRVRQFIPSLDVSMLNQRGVSGVRSSLIDNKGFVPEAVQLSSDRSLHILNYNSPGATGAPCFSAFIVSNLKTRGFLDGLKHKASGKHAELWNFENASDLRIS